MSFSGYSAKKYSKKISHRQKQKQTKEISESDKKYQNNNFK